METIKGFLEGTRFFKEFTSEEKDVLVQIQNIYLKFNAGEIIIQEGEVDQALYIVLSGQVVVNKKGLEGLIISYLGPGSIFGEISLIRKHPRTTNVVADGEVVVMKIDKKMIDQLDPRLQKKFQDQLIQVLIERLAEMNQKYINAMFFNL